MDLLPYLNFSIELDNRVTPALIRFNDTSTYPEDVAPLVTGFFSITQPDGITVQGDFGTPDIDIAGNVFTDEKTLRIASDGAFQNGTYYITYTARAAGYDDSNISKTFLLNYTRPELTIAPSFDVFTPSLKVNDTTSYVAPGFTLVTVVQSWSAVVAGIGTISDTGSDQFDLLYNNNYYDASYNVTLLVNTAYYLNGAPWVVIFDSMTTSARYRTEVPLSLNELYTEITAYKTTIVNDCCAEDDRRKSNYIYAFTLFQHFIMRGRCGSRIPLREMVDEIQMILNNGADPIYTPTKRVISHYSFTDFCGCDCEGTGSTGGGDTIMEIVIGASDDYLISVDKTQLIPIDDFSTHTLIDKEIVSLYLEGQRVPFIPRSESVWASFNASTGTITLNNGTFENDTYVAINYRSTTSEVS